MNFSFNHCKQTDQWHHEADRCSWSKRTRIGHFYMTSLQLLRFYWDLWITPVSFWPPFQDPQHSHACLFLHRLCQPCLLYWLSIEAGSSTELSSAHHGISSSSSRFSWFFITPGTEGHASPFLCGIADGKVLDFVYLLSSWQFETLSVSLCLFWHLKQTLGNGFESTNSAEYDGILLLNCTGKLMKPTASRSELYFILIPWWGSAHLSFFFFEWKIGILLLNWNVYIQEYRRRAKPHMTASSKRTCIFS